VAPATGTHTLAAHFRELHHAEVLETSNEVATPC